MRHLYSYSTGQLVIFHSLVQGDVQCTFEEMDGDPCAVPLNGGDAYPITSPHQIEVMPPDLHEYGLGDRVILTTDLPLTTYGVMRCRGMVGSVQRSMPNLLEVEIIVDGEAYAVHVDNLTQIRPLVQL